MLARKPAAVLRISPVDLLGPPIGDSLAGSRMLAERFAGKSDTVPAFAVDLLAQGRRLEMVEAEPASDYEHVAWAFYTGEIDADVALTVLNDMFDVDVDDDHVHAVEAHRTATAA